MKFYFIKKDLKIIVIEVFKLKSFKYFYFINFKIQELQRQKRKAWSNGQATVKTQ